MTSIIEFTSDFMNWYCHETTHQEVYAGMFFLIQNFEILRWNKLTSWELYLHENISHILDFGTNLVSDT